MVSITTQSAVDCGCRFYCWSGQTKAYKIGIWCFSTKHTTLRSKNKVWLVQNRDFVCVLNNMSTWGLLFQWVSAITQHVCYTAVHLKLNNSRSLMASNLLYIDKTTANQYLIPEFLGQAQKCGWLILIISNFFRKTRIIRFISDVSSKSESDMDLIILDERKKILIIFLSIISQF